MATKLPTRKELMTVASSYATLYFGYDNRFIMSQEQAIRVMQALDGAEIIHGGNYISDNEVSQVTPIAKDVIELKVIPEQRYLNMKMSVLLNVSLESLEKKIIEEEEPF